MGELEQESKYYTPSIEEFHVGFEYELYRAGEEGSKKWIRKVIERSDYIGLIEFYLRSDSASDKIRVKYLDKSDIESLGFEEWVKDKLPGETLGSPYDKFTEASYIVGTNLDGKSFGATVFYGNIVDSTYIRIEGAIAPGPVYGYIGGHPLFKGTIKNKSEFNKILGQLSIEIYHEKI